MNNLEFKNDTERADYYQKVFTLEVQRNRDVKSDSDNNLASARYYKMLFEDYKGRYEKEKAIAEKSARLTAELELKLKATKRKLQELKIQFELMGKR